MHLRRTPVLTDDGNDDEVPVVEGSGKQSASVKSKSEAEAAISEGSFFLDPGRLGIRSDEQIVQDASSPLQSGSSGGNECKQQ